MRIDLDEDGTLFDADALLLDALKPEDINVELDSLSTSLEQEQRIGDWVVERGAYISDDGQWLCFHWPRTKLEVLDGDWRAAGLRVLEAEHESS